MIYAFNFINKFCPFWFCFKITSIIFIAVIDHDLVEEISLLNRKSPPVTVHETAFV